MRVLIIGGAGFVGTNLRARLGPKHEVAIFDRERTDLHRDECRYIRGDISDYLSIAKAFDDFKPDVVFHLAGMVSRRECEETQLLAIQVNLIGTYNICSLCTEYGARLIYAGSSEEYGRGFTDEEITETSPFGPATGIYSLTKRFAEEVIQHFSHSKGLTASVTRFFMLYGPGEPFNEYRSAITRFVHLALNNDPLPVHLDTSRSWCYVTDAIDALELLLEREQEELYEVYNIGRDEQTYTIDLANLIKAMTDSESEIVETQIESTIIPHKVANFSHIKEVLGWEAKIPLMKGLENVITEARKGK